MEDPLKILGISPGDSLDLAKKRRNALFVKLHPDKNKKDKENYQKVYDAYDLLVKNPNLLDPPLIKNILQLNKYDIKAQISITLEDIYFRRMINATIKRFIFCKKCNGTKTKGGIKDYCVQCNGKGEINSKVLELLNKSPICPKCNGLGFPRDKICDKCNGTGVEAEIIPISFDVNFKDYYNKSKTIPNAGNQISFNKFGDLIIHFKIEHDTRVKIEDEYFVIYDKILPIQKIIGDEKIIEIFGRTVSYKIEKNSQDAYTLDRISDSLTQEIRIKFIDIPAKFTDETIILYKKILNIEKGLLNG